MKKQEVEVNDILDAAPVALAIFLVIAAAAYTIFKLCDNHSYNEKWKDYDECGLG